MTYFNVPPVVHVVVNVLKLKLNLTTTPHLRMYFENEIQILKNKFNFFYIVALKASFNFFLVFTSVCSIRE